MELACTLTDIFCRSVIVTYAGFLNKNKFWFWLSLVCQRTKGECFRFYLEFLKEIIQMSKTLFPIVRCRSSYVPYCDVQIGYLLYHICKDYTIFARKENLENTSKNLRQNYSKNLVCNMMLQTSIERLLFCLYQLLYY